MGVFIASENYHRIYSGNKLSFAFIFCFFVWAMIFIAPFFLAFTTRNFWPTSEYYYEQPAVVLQPDVIIFGQTDEKNCFYSNIDVINRKIPNTGDLSPIIKYANIDENNDNLPERITFKALLYVNATSLQSLDVFLFFNYGFRLKARLQMQSVVKVSFSALNGQGIYKASAFGDLKFKQEITLQSSFYTQNLYNKTEYNDVDAFNPIDFLRKYMTRNQTLEYQPVIYQGSGISGQNYSVIEAEFRIPIFQPIEYVPTIIDSWKTAWTQYVSLFVPLYIFWKFVMNFVFQTKILGTCVSSNLPKI